MNDYYPPDMASPGPEEGRRALWLWRQDQPWPHPPSCTSRREGTLVDCDCRPGQRTVPPVDYICLSPHPLGPLGAVADWAWPDAIDWAALVDRTVRRLVLGGLAVGVALGAGGAAILTYRRRAR